MAERPITPSTADIIRAWIEAYAQDLHTAIPGRVHSIDLAAGTVDVEPVVRHAVLQPDGSRTYEDLPILPAVPLVVPSAHEAFVWVPVKAGDTVLVVFSESAIGHWWAGDGEPQYPGDLRRHDLSHAFAIPGPRIRQRALRHAHAENIVMGFDADDGVRVSIKPTGEVVITQGSAVVLQIDADGTNHLAGALGSLVALAPLVMARLQTIQQVFDLHVHPDPVSGSTGPPTGAIGPLDDVAATKTKAT